MKVNWLEKLMMAKVLGGIFMGSNTSLIHTFICVLMLFYPPLSTCPITFSCLSSSKAMQPFKHWQEYI